MAKDRKNPGCFWGTPETSYFDPLLVQVQQRAGRRVSDGISKLHEARLSYVIEAHFCVPKETGNMFLCLNYIGGRGVAS